MEQQNEQQNDGKVGKKFDEALGRLTKLLNGDALYKPTKLGNEDVTAAIQELAKEEKAKILGEFKEKAVKLIQSKREFDTFVKQQENELKKKKEEKQKSFTKDAEDLFALMEKAEKIEQSYAQTLGAAEEGKELGAE